MKSAADRRTPSAPVHSNQDRNKIRSMCHVVSNTRRLWRLMNYVLSVRLAPRFDPHREQGRRIDEKARRTRHSAKTVVHQQVPDSSAKRPVNCVTKCWNDAWRGKPFQRRSIAHTRFSSNAWVRSTQAVTHQRVLLCLGSETWPADGSSTRPFT